MSAAILSTNLRRPRPEFDGVASAAYSDYLVACNVTDSLDHPDPIDSDRYKLWLLARDLEDAAGRAFDAVARVAYGFAHRDVSE